MYADGRGFVPDRIRDGELTVSFPSPSSVEEEHGQSGLGTDWLTVRDSYLPLAGVESGDVNITHAVRCRYRKKKGNGQWYSMVFDKMFQTREVRAAMHHCKVHDKDIKGEKLIVAMGELGHLKYGGPAANDSQQIWRGHLAPEV